MIDVNYVKGIASLVKTLKGLVVTDTVHVEITGSYTEQYIITFSKLENNYTVMVYRRGHIVNIQQCSKITDVCCYIHNTNNLKCVLGRYVSHIFKNNHTIF